MHHVISSFSFRLSDPNVATSHSDRAKMISSVFMEKTEWSEWRDIIKPDQPYLEKRRGGFLNWKQKKYHELNEAESHKSSEDKRRLRTHELLLEMCHNKSGFRGSA